MTWDVSQNGGLLPYNIEKDQEDFENKKGALFEIHKQAAQFLLLRINEIQSQLPDNYSLFFSYPPDVAKMIRQIQTWKDLNMRPPLPGRSLCELQIEELESAQYFLGEAAIYIEKAYGMQLGLFEGFFPPFIKQSSFVLRFPFDERATREYFLRGKIVSDKTTANWKNAFDKIQKYQVEGWPDTPPESLQHFSNFDLYPSLAAFKGLLLSLQPTTTALQLLGNPTPETLGKLYGAKTLIVHPDKLEKSFPPSLPPEQKKAILDQATVLLECLQQAKEELKNDPSFSSQK